MEGKSLSGKFPASGFLKLARLVEAEGEPFQLHVLDLLRDMKEDSDFCRDAMATLRQKLAHKDIDDFLKLMPAATGYAAGSAHVKEIIRLSAELDGSHFSTADAAHVMAAELIHRKKWEKVMEENPGTLQELKNRMV
jgi:hypothetical protein